MLTNLVERRLDRHEIVDAAGDVVRHHQITRSRGGERIARALHEFHRLRQRQLQRECQPYHRPTARLIMRLRELVWIILGIGLMKFGNKNSLKSKRI